MQLRGTAKTAYRQDLYVTWSFEEKLAENKAVNINPPSIYGLISKLWRSEVLRQVTVVVLVTLIDLS